MATIDELALLSKSSYGGSNETIPSGWVQLKFKIDETEQLYYEGDHGFAGALYGHKIGVDANGNDICDEVVVAIRGTEVTSINDLNNDLAILKGKAVDQKESLDAFKLAVDEELTNRGLTSVNKTITGQSLGGSLAQIMGANTGLTTVTFDAFGVEYSLNECKPYSNVTNYVVANDPVGTYNYNQHVGNVVLLYPIPMDTGALGALNPHNYIPFYNNLSI